MRGTGSNNLLHLSPQKERIPMAKEPQMAEIILPVCSPGISYVPVCRLLAPNLLTSSSFRLINTTITLFSLNFLHDKESPGVLDKNRFLNRISNRKAWHSVYLINTQVIFTGGGGWKQLVQCISERNVPTKCPLLTPLV